MTLLTQLLVAGMLQLPVSNDTLGYRFTVPEGFAPFPEGRGDNPKMVDCWADSTSAALVLCVSRLGLTMGTDTLEAKDLPPNARRVRFKWGEFDLQGFVFPLKRGDEEMSLLAVQIPLRREAIQLTIGGPPADEARADSLMRVTLASLQGESNWLTRSQRAEKLGEVIGYWLSAIIGVGVLTWIYRRRKRATPVRRPPPPRPNRPATRPPSSAPPKPPAK